MRKRRRVRKRRFGMWIRVAVGVWGRRSMLCKSGGAWDKRRECVRVRVQEGGRERDTSKGRRSAHSAGGAMEQPADIPKEDSAVAMIS